jgi:hypothetical protein
MCVGQIKAYYGCNEIKENGSLYIHIVLWLNDSPNPNTLIQKIHDDQDL